MSLTRLHTSESPSARRAVRLVWRALRLCCPNCGQRGIFRRWFTMLPECPRCQLPFERKEQGYFVGAYMLNIVVAELIWLAIGIAVVVGTWPDPPWTALTWGGAAIMALTPVACYPLSKTLFLALDLAFRPLGRE